MLEQTGNALTFYVFFVSSKQGKTGLSPTVDVWRGTTQVVTGGAATALGGGLYYYTLAAGSVTTEAEYLAIFKTTDTTVDQQHIPALWVVGRAGIENLDAAITSRPTAAAAADAVWDEAIADHLTTGSTGAKLNAAASAGDPWATALPGGYASGTAGARLGLVGTSQINVAFPVSDSGNVTVRQGRDYASAIGSAIRWTLTNPPSPAPSSVTFTCLALGFSKVCSYSAPVITLELTSAETATFGAGVYLFEVEAVISGLKHPGLVQGQLIVERDV